MALRNGSFHPVLLYDGKAILSADRIETQPGSIILFDLQGEKPLWELPFFHQMDYAPVIRGGKLIGSVWSIDLATGKQLFDRSPVPGESASFCVLNDLMIYQRDERTIAALDIRAARGIWERSLPSPLRSNLVACGKAVCAKVTGQKLAVLNASDGALSYYIPLLKPTKSSR